MVAAAFLHPSLSRVNHLVILNDGEEAAYFHNTLENLTGALDIFIFLLLLRTGKITNC